MSEQEYETLKRSMERFGFKSFVVVEETSPGSYGIVDGHHRYKAAVERQMDRIPVVLLDAGLETSWADLAMLTFNVTGDPLEAPFIDLLSELTGKLGAEAVADYTALDRGFLENFSKEMEETLAALSAESEDEDEEARVRGHALMIELPRVEGVKELLNRVMHITGEAVVGQAVLKALQAWVEIAGPVKEMIAAHVSDDEDDDT